MESCYSLLHMAHGVLGGDGSGRYGRTGQDGRRRGEMGRGRARLSLGPHGRAVWARVGLEALGMSGRRLRVVAQTTAVGRRGVEGDDSLYWIGSMREDRKTLYIYHDRITGGAWEQE